MSQNTKQIDLEIFKILEDKKSEFETTLRTKLEDIMKGSNETYDKFFNDLKSIKETIHLFMRLSISQFFHNGYGIQYEKLDQAAINSINSISDNNSIVKYPKEMITFTNDFFNYISETLTRIGYGGIDSNWKLMYCTHLFNLVRCIVSDSRDVFSNFAEIEKKGCEIMRIITTNCQKMS